VSIVLILGVVSGLLNGYLSYNKETHTAKLGLIELSVKDKQMVNVPDRAGMGKG
jgi:hypothetical protein